jgi:hypothetical protein
MNIFTFVSSHQIAKAFPGVSRDTRVILFLIFVFVFITHCHMNGLKLMQYYQ